MKYYYYAYNVGYNYSRYMQFIEEWKVLEEMVEAEKSVDRQPHLNKKLVHWSPLYDLVFKTDENVFNDIVLSMKYIKNLRAHQGEQNKKLLNMKRKRPHLSRAPPKPPRMTLRAGN